MESFDFVEAVLSNKTLWIPRTGSLSDGDRMLLAVPTSDAVREGTEALSAAQHSGLWLSWFCDLFAHCGAAEAEWLLECVGLEHDYQLSGSPYSPAMHIREAGAFGRLQRQIDFAREARIRQALLPADLQMLEADVYESIEEEGVCELLSGMVNLNHW